ncbi:MAG: tetratricopeptide repeat protein [bacterium]|nr:tetratricopeptide repeat protein [bacterium]
MPKKKNKKSKKRTNRSFTNNLSMIQVLEKPIYRCLQSEDLFEDGLGYVIITRKGETGPIAAVFFLLDAFCLGVKDVFIRVIPESELNIMLDAYCEDDSFIPIEPSSARKLVEGAEEYARQLGFHPHKNYANARIIFDDIDKNDSAAIFTFGKDGKPFFVSGMDDSLPKCEKILDKLMDTVGPDGFEFYTPYHEEYPSDITEDENAKIEEKIDKALALITNDNVKKGGQILTGLLKKYPQNSKAHYGMGILSVYKDDMDSGINYFNNAIEIEPGFVEAHFNKAVACMKNIDMLGTLKSFKKVDETGDPHDPLVQKAQEYLKDFEQEFTKKEGANIDSYIEAAEIFGNAVTYLAEENWEEALVFFKESLDIIDDNYQAYGNMAICYAKLGKKKLALEALDKSLAINPDYELALVNKIKVKLMEEGQTLEAKSEVIDYEKEYSLKNKSYIKEVFGDKI